MEPNQTTEPTSTPSNPATSDWKQQIPEELRQEKVWESVPDLPSLFKQFVDAQRYIGGSVRIPGEDATAEQRAQFFNKLGRPESPNDYRYQAPEGIDIPDAVMTQLRQVAHEEGMSTRQFQRLTEAYLGHEAGKARQLSEEADQVIGALKNDWGAAYDRKIGLGQRVLNTVFGDEVIEALRTSPLGNNRKFIEGLAKLGEQLSEHSLINAPIEGVRTRDDAMAEARKLMADPAYLNKRDPKHKEIVDRVHRYFQEAHL